MFQCNGDDKIPPTSNQFLGCRCYIEAEQSCLDRTLPEKGPPDQRPTCQTRGVCTPGVLFCRILPQQIDIINAVDPFDRVVCYSHCPCANSHEELSANLTTEISISIH